MYPERYRNRWDPNHYSQAMWKGSKTEITFLDQPQWLWDERTWRGKSQRRWRCVQKTNRNDLNKSIYRCTYTYIHACIHAYIRTYIHTYIYMHILFNTLEVDQPSFFAPCWDVSCRSVQDDRVRSLLGSPCGCIEQRQKKYKLGTHGET